MLAYHNRPELKSAVLAQLAQHREADRIKKGHYWERGKGCAVGCTLESLRQIEGLAELAHADHALYERYLGVPMMLARLEDGLFEALPNGTSQAWPERFAAAIRPGADLSMVGPKFLHWLLSDADGPVQRQCAKRLALAASVQRVIDLYARWIAGAKPSDTEWREASDVAWRLRAAAADAADAAAAAAYAAAAAADAAADAAYAADAAAAAADAAAERIRQADALIALLEAA